MRSADLSRRTFIAQSALIAGGVSLGLYSCKDNNSNLLQGVQDFLHRVANEDGSFRPGIDPDYKGTSDTGLSGIAAPAYATIISSTFGWSLPYPDKTREFFFSCQKPDGAFYPPTGSMDHINSRMREYLINGQTEDGYIGNHVASTFHAAHYFRLIGEPTPKADVMIDRVIEDQKEDGSWHLWEPEMDVHASFDALFILRQLGNPKDPRIQQAYKKATNWILKCHKPDGGFTHFPDETISDVDSLYFHVGGLVETGTLKISKNLTNEEILGWGHAMDPEKTYSCITP